MSFPIGLNLFKAITFREKEFVKLMDTFSRLPSISIKFLLCHLLNIPNKSTAEEEQSEDERFRFPEAPGSFCK